MTFFIRKEKISNGEYRIILTPISKSAGEKFYNETVLKGQNFVELELLPKEIAKNKKQERLYRKSLESVAEALSDVNKKWTPEDVHKYFKKLFCEYKIMEGVDLFHYYPEKNDKGEIVMLREPKSFDSKIDGNIFKEYVSYYVRHCEARLGFNPMEDAKDRMRIKDIKFKAETGLDPNLGFNVEGW